jgi:hypothetical protein
LFQESFQLNQGQSIQRAVPGNGNGQSSGFGGSSGPFNHQECFFVTNSFDPNDKDATPLGYGPEHYVHPGTPLEYRIRFQNTGTDTAFLVVIRDTLSSFLDAGKIEARSASHPFKMALINGNILQFTFQNILLPDSTTNKEASQGFVEFEVYPVADLPKGTEVLNNAAIYFDFNEPVITNTVKRVYGEYVMVAINDPVGPATLPVKVFPNPFVSAATFELPVEGDYQLLLMDEAGRELKTIAFSGASCLLQRDQLPAGALLWSIRSNGVQVASGSLIAR